MFFRKNSRGGTYFRNRGRGSGPPSRSVPDRKPKWLKPNSNSQKNPNWPEAIVFTNIETLENCVETKQSKQDRSVVKSRNASLKAKLRQKANVFLPQAIMCKYTWINALIDNRWSKAKSSIVSPISAPLFCILFTEKTAATTGFLHLSNGTALLETGKPSDQSALDQTPATGASPLTGTKAMSNSPPRKSVSKEKIFKGPQTAQVYEFVFRV